MSLTDEQKQGIRDEEFFRAEVRKELASAGGPPSFLTRLSAFFDTKAGFWLLTTALAGLVATGITSLQRYTDREEIARRETAERSLRDAETVLKLAPMLTSERLSEVKIAIVLLTGLASDAAVEARVATQVMMLIDETLKAGVQQSATPQEQARAAAIISYADKPRIEVIQGSEMPATPDAPVATRVVAAALDSALPVRVYIQIGQQSDRPLAEDARDKLRGAGLVIPGIELVGAGRTPKRDSVRYCQEKVAPDAVERVQAAVGMLAVPVPDFNVLDRKLCGNVRFNHFELWFARRPE